MLYERLASDFMPWNIAVLTQIDDAKKITPQRDAFESLPLPTICLPFIALLI